MAAHCFPKAKVVGSSPIKRLKRSLPFIFPLPRPIKRLKPSLPFIFPLPLFITSSFYYYFFLFVKGQK